MIRKRLQVLHAHVLLVAPLGSCDMSQAGAYQHQSRIAVREGTNHPGAPPDLPVQALDDIVDAAKRRPRPIMSLGRNPILPFSETPHPC